LLVFVLVLVVAGPCRTDLVGVRVEVLPRPGRPGGARLRWGQGRNQLRATEHQRVLIKGSQTGRREASCLPPWYRRGPSPTLTSPGLCARHGLRGIPCGSSSSGTTGAGCFGPKAARVGQR